MQNFLKKDTGNYRRAYNHSGLQQKGWTYNAPKAGSFQGKLQDEVYHSALALHNPLWRYITTHYPKELPDYARSMTRKMEASVVILGYTAIPVAIELSQWGYPITFIAENFAQIEQARKDCKLQAGIIGKEYMASIDYGTPGAYVTCFMGIIDEPRFDDLGRLYKFLDRLVRNCGEIICTVRRNKDWHRILNDRYKVEGLIYPDEKYLFLSITALR